jgi:cell division protein FtsW
MTTTTAPAQRLALPASSLRLDPVTVGLALSILLLGLVMVTSASISMAAREAGGNPFSYLTRQVLLTLFSVGCGAALFMVPTERYEQHSQGLLILALVLLLAVLVPGLGHVVNGSRRWLQVVGFNFQASEGARVLVLLFIAAYAVRRETELRTTFKGLFMPLLALPRCWS